MMKRLVLAVVALGFLGSIKATTKITAILGDITTQQVDIIVNAANPQLAFGGGVCGYIFKAAGIAQLQKACNQYPLVKGVRCPVGQAKVTGSFNLQKIGVKKIVHAVGPDAAIVKDPTQQTKLLKSTYINSLQLATQGGYKTIAFPFISAGIYHVDANLAAEAAVTAARDFVEANKTTLTEIRFVLYTQTALTIFQDLLNG